jgi:hypothetical protein
MSIDDAAVLEVLRAAGLAEANLDLEPDGGSVFLRQAGVRLAALPRGEGAGSWRSTVNASLLPRSLSPESRDLTLFAVIQDQVKDDWRLHLKATPGEDPSRLPNPLSEAPVGEPRLKAFQELYRRTIKSGEQEKHFFVPIHVGIPCVFDSYTPSKTKPQHDGGPPLESTQQTSKGFRGPFVEFLCTAGGTLQTSVLHALRENWMATDALNPVERAFVVAMGRRLVGARDGRAPAALPDRTFLEGNGRWWGEAYRPLRSASEFMPTQGFEPQHRRFVADLLAVTRAPGLGRADRIAALERVMALHFGVFIVRLAAEALHALSLASQLLGEAVPAAGHWAGAGPLVLRFHAPQRGPVSRRLGEAYAETMDRLKQVHVVLPVVNMAEVALRAAIRGRASQATTRPPAAGRLKWRELVAILDRDPLTERERALAVTVLRVIAARARRDVRPADMASTADLLAGLDDRPLRALHDTVRDYYDGTNARYPKEHVQTPFEQILQVGAESVIQQKPRVGRYVAMGDDLASLLATCALHEAEGDDPANLDVGFGRADAAAPGMRIPLKTFQETLRSAYLFEPADDEAWAALQRSLARQGFIDRHSDIGEANFLRVPGTR